MTEHAHTLKFIWRQRDIYRKALENIAAFYDVGWPDDADDMVAIRNIAESALRSAIEPLNETMVVSSGDNIGP